MSAALPEQTGLLVAVLAAGQGRRFGGGKLDAPCAGQRLGAWALRAVADAGLAPGIIVTGPDAPSFARAAAGWTCLANPQAATGLASSLRHAGAFALAGGYAAMLVLLADMPLMPGDYVRTLAACRGPAATAQGDGRAGVPVLLPRAMFGALADLRGDRGAGALLAGVEGLRVLEAPAEALLDVDRPEQLDAVARVLAGRGLRRGEGV